MFGLQRAIDRLDTLIDLTADSRKESAHKHAELRTEVTRRMDALESEIKSIREEQLRARRNGANGHKAPLSPATKATAVGGGGAAGGAGLLWLLQQLAGG